ncbi:non-ribosomal peptide synthetase, partial [Streptomyces sp. 5-6(2022)]|uniref:non-ribosomal peptide synthetase n=1 Tax=Streptomyces sp. 5-6(2022) TaxID=2936510 RepID=UPI0023B9CB93
MTTDELLLALAKADVKLWLDGDRLVYRAAKGAMTRELREQLITHKADLIRLLQQDQATVSAPTARTEAPGDAAQALSSGQERLWLIERLADAGPLYNVHFKLHWKGALDTEILHDALSDIVARHAPLRTTFTEVDGVPRAITSPRAAVEVAHSDVRDHAPEARTGAADEEILAHQRAPFDLAHGPLMRTAVITLADDDHIVLFTQHHIISDGWSIGLFLAELGELYRARHLGEKATLPELPLRYADYVRWQQEQRETPHHAAHVAWWQDHLADLPPLALHRDHPALPGTPDHSGSDHEFVLSAALTRQLKDMAQDQECTLHTVLLAAWAILLHRHAAQDDFAVGLVTSGRDHAEFQNLIGFFANTLALRCDLSGDPTVVEVIRRMSHETEAVLEREIPFADVVAATGAPRDASLTPLIQTAFVFENIPVPDVLSASAPHGLPATVTFDARIGGAVEGTTKFDLSLNMKETSDGISGRIEYANTRFDAATIRRLHEHFVTLLRSMVRTPHEQVGRLELLTAHERHLLLVEWNDTSRAYPEHQSLHDLFAEQARRSPSAVAAVHGERTLTYAELDARADRLARRLRSLGVTAGDNVALLMDRSLELVTAEVAVLRAGGICVPLDPSHPHERLAFLIADSESRHLLTTQGRPLPAHDGVIRVDVDGDADDAVMSEQRPLPAVSSDAPAYILYTSGSTGVPKGVVLSHRALVRLVVSDGLIPVDDAIHAAFASSPTFDISTLEIWTPLVNGGRIVVIDQHTLRDPRRFGAALTHHAVTFLWMTVGLFNQYADEIAAEIGALRHLVVGGDALNPDVIGRVARSHPPRHLLNGYGPTESNIATSFEIRHVPEGAQTIPIGRPLPNTRVYILDKHRQPVPIGVTGELYIAGAGVAEGYFKRPELTAERFVRDPFGSRPDARMYRTGDLGRWLPDGTIDFLGRNDFQVKVRGFRIEPGEIEARLLESTEISQVVVLAREDTPGDKRLVAYYASAGEIGAEVLRDRLLEQLPAYMVPVAFVRLPALPLTPNGKVDRRSLPAPSAAAYATRAYEAPADETETALATIWAELLDVDRVGRHDDFFELGGHSLLTVQVMSRIRRVLGVEVPLGDLFARPVLADFASRVLEASSTVLPPVTPAEARDRHALSFTQRRLWFLAQADGVSEAYHISGGLRLRGPLDKAALRRALDRIVARHEALRTTFVLEDEQPVQRVAPVAESRFHLQERQVQADSTLSDLLTAEAAVPFDLTEGPLIRGCLIPETDDCHLLQVTMHHIVSDGWSLGVFFQELATLYGTYVSREEETLPDLPVQYADYAAWQRRWMSGDAIRHQARYWEQTLAAAPTTLTLPTDRPRPARQDHAGDTLSFELGESLTKSLEALSARHGTTLFMTLLSGWAALLARYSGQDDLVVGIPSANRGRSELEGLIGSLVNTLPVRVDLTGSPTVQQLLGQVKRHVVGAQENQDIPFEEIVRLANPVRSPAHNPLFQVMFAWQKNDLLRSVDLAGLDTEILPVVPNGTSKVDLTLFMEEMASEERGTTVAGTLEFATALFDADTAARLVDSYLTLLHGMAEDDSLTVDRLPILSAVERELVVGGWNATEAVFPEVSVHGLFEEWVVRDPGAVAVVCGSESLTYGEL